MAGKKTETETENDDGSEKLCEALQCCCDELQKRHTARASGPEGPAPKGGLLDGAALESLIEPLLLVALNWLKDRILKQTA